MSAITDTQEWQALVAHFESIRDVHLRDLFADDPDRGTRLTAEVDGIYLDYSKHRLTAETVGLLVAVAERAGAARARRRDVPGRQDQRHREPRRAPRRAPGAGGRA